MNYTRVVHGVHYIDSKNLKKFPFGVSTTTLLCDYLEKIHVWMFADSKDAGASPNVTRKPTSDPYYFLTSYFKPVVRETNPTSNLINFRSILMNFL